MATGDEQDLIEAVVTCEGNLHDPDFQNRFRTLVNNLKTALYISKTKDPFRVRKIEPWNSVRVTISIPKEAAQKLKLLAQQGSNVLRSMGILSVQVEGDQVISLTWAAQNNEATQVILRQTSDETAGSSGTSGVSSSSLPASSPSISSISSSVASISSPIPLTPGPSGDTSGMAVTLDMLSSSSSSSLSFRSPNVVAPSGEAIPVLPPKATATSVRPVLGGPFPFVSMTHAAQAIQRSEMSPMMSSNNIMVSNNTSGSNAANSTNSVVSSVPSSTSLIQGSNKSMQPPQSNLPVTVSNHSSTSGAPVIVSTSTCNVVTAVTVNSEPQVTRLVIENSPGLNPTTQVVGSNVASLGISGTNNVALSHAGPSQSLQLQLVNVPPPYPGVNTISSNHSLSSSSSHHNSNLSSNVQSRHPQPTLISNVGATPHSTVNSILPTTTIVDTLTSSQPLLKRTGKGCGTEAPSSASAVCISDSTSGVSSMAQPVSSPLLVNLLQNNDISPGSSSSNSDTYNHQQKLLQKNVSASTTQGGGNDTLQAKYLVQQQQQQSKKTKRGLSLEGAPSVSKSTPVGSGAFGGTDSVSSVSVPTSRSSTTETFQFSLPLPSDVGSCVTMNRVSAPLASCNNSKVGSLAAHPTSNETSSTAVIQGRTIVQGSIRLLDQGSGQIRTIPVQHQPLPLPYPSPSGTATTVHEKTAPTGETSTTHTQLAVNPENTTLPNGPINAPLTPLSSSEKDFSEALGDIKSQSLATVTLVHPNEHQPSDRDAPATVSTASSAADQSRTLLPITTVNIVSNSSNKHSSNVNSNSSKESDSKTFIPPPDPRLSSQVQKLSHSSNSVSARNSVASNLVVQTTGYNSDAKSSTSQAQHIGRTAIIHKRLSKERAFLPGQITSPGKPRQFLINPLTGHLEPMPSESSSESEEGDDGDGETGRKSNSYKSSVSKNKTGKGVTLPVGFHHRQIVTTETGVTVARVIKASSLDPNVAQSFSDLDGKKSSGSIGKGIPFSGNSADSNPSSVISVSKKPREDSTAVALHTPKDSKDNNPSPATVTATSVTGEKIKLRLKLEKSEPISPAYKVDVSFVKKSEKSSFMPTIVGTSSSSTCASSASLSASSSYSHSSTGDQPRVPPLHISLRGKNAAVVVSPRREEKDMPPPSSVIGNTKESLVISSKDPNALENASFLSMSHHSKPHLSNSHEGKVSSSKSMGSAKRIKNRVKSFDGGNVISSGSEKVKSKMSRPKLSKEVNDTRPISAAAADDSKDPVHLTMPVLLPAVVLPLPEVTKRDHGPQQPNRMSNVPVVEGISLSGNNNVTVTPPEMVSALAPDKLQVSEPELPPDTSSMQILPDCVDAHDLKVKESERSSHIAETTVEVVAENKCPAVEHKTPMTLSPAVSVVTENMSQETISTVHSDTPDPIEDSNNVKSVASISGDVEVRSASELFIAKGKPSHVSNTSKGAFISPDVSSVKDEGPSEQQLPLHQQESCDISKKPDNPQMETSRRDESFVNPVINLSTVSCDIISKSSTESQDASVEKNNSTGSENKLISHQQPAAVTSSGKEICIGATPITPIITIEEPIPVKRSDEEDETTIEAERSAMIESKHVETVDISVERKIEVSSPNSPSMITNDDKVNAEETDSKRSNFEGPDILRKDTSDTVAPTELIDNRTEPSPGEELNLETAGQSDDSVTCETPSSVANSEIESQEPQNQESELKVTENSSTEAPAVTADALNVEVIEDVQEESCTNEQEQSEKEEVTSMEEETTMKPTEENKDVQSLVIENTDEPAELVPEPVIPTDVCIENHEEAADIKSLTGTVAVETPKDPPQTTTEQIQVGTEDTEKISEDDKLNDEECIELQKKIETTCNEVDISTTDVSTDPKEDALVTKDTTCNKQTVVSSEIQSQVDADSEIKCNPSDQNEINFDASVSTESESIEADMNVSNHSQPMEKTKEPEQISEDVVVNEICEKSEPIVITDVKEDEIISVSPEVGVEDVDPDKHVSATVIEKLLETAEPSPEENQKALSDDNSENEEQHEQRGPPVTDELQTHTHDQDTEVNIPETSDAEESVCLDATQTEFESNVDAKVADEDLINEVVDVSSVPIENLEEIEVKSVESCVNDIPSVGPITKDVAKPDDKKVEQLKVVAEGSKESATTAPQLVSVDSSVPKSAKKIDEKPHPSIDSDTVKNDSAGRSGASKKVGSDVNVTIMTPKKVDLPTATTNTPPISIVLPSETVLRAGNPDAKGVTSKNAYKRRAEIKPGALQNTLKRLHDNFLPKVLKTSDKQDALTQSSKAASSHVADKPAKVTDNITPSANSTVTVVPTTSGKMPTLSQSVSIAIPQVRPMPNVIQRQKLATSVTATGGPMLHQIPTGLQQNILAVSTGISTASLTSVASLSVASSSLGGQPQTVFAIHPNVSIPANFAQLQQSPVVLPGGHKMVPIKLVTLPKQSSGQLQTIPLGNATPNRSSPNLLEAVNIVANAGSRSSSPKTTLIGNTVQTTPLNLSSMSLPVGGNLHFVPISVSSATGTAGNVKVLMTQPIKMQQTGIPQSMVVKSVLMGNQPTTIRVIRPANLPEPISIQSLIKPMSEPGAVKLTNEKPDTPLVESVVPKTEYTITSDSLFKKLDGVEIVDTGSPLNNDELPFQADIIHDEKDLEDVLASEAKEDVAVTENCTQFHPTITSVIGSNETSKFKTELTTPASSIQNHVTSKKILNISRVESSAPDSPGPVMRVTSPLYTYSASSKASRERSSVSASPSPLGPDLHGEDEEIINSFSRSPSQPRLSPQNKSNDFDSNDMKLRGADANPDHTYGMSATVDMVNCDNPNRLGQELSIEIPPIDMEAALSPSQNPPEGKRCTRSTRSNPRLSPDITAFVSETSKTNKLASKVDLMALRSSPKPSPTGSLKVLSPTPSSLTITPSTSTRSSPILHNQHQINATNAAATINAVAMGIIDKIQGNATAQNVKNSRISKLTGANKRKRQESDSSSASRDENMEDKAEIDLNSRPGKRKCSENAAEMIKVCIGVEDSPKRNSSTGSKKTEELKMKDGKGKKPMTTLLEEDDDIDSEVSLSRGRSGRSSRESSEDRSSSRGSSAQRVVVAEKTKAVKEDDTSKETKSSRTNSRIIKDNVSKTKNIHPERATPHTNSTPAKKVKESGPGKAATRRVNRPNSKNKSPLTPAKTRTNVRKEVTTTQASTEKNATTVTSTSATPDGENARRKTRSSAAGKRHVT